MDFPHNPQSYYITYGYSENLNADPKVPKYPVYHHQFLSATSSPIEHSSATMAGAQLGLKVAFYAYPCSLFVILLGVQSLQYYLNRHGTADRNILDTDQKKRTEKIQRICSKLIWVLQLLLSLLLLASIIITVREAVAGNYEGIGRTDFPVSPYVVCVAIVVENPSHCMILVNSGLLGVICWRAALLCSRFAA